MTPQKIDELEGTALVIAIVTELGYSKLENKHEIGQAIVEKRKCWFINVFGRVAVTFPQPGAVYGEFRPDHYLDAAWKLDDPGSENGYEWEFSEQRDWKRKQNYVQARACDGRHNFYGQGVYNGKAEKPNAYATARCRAWLKAMAAQHPPGKSKGVIWLKEYKGYPSPPHLTNNPSQRHCCPR